MLTSIDGRLMKRSVRVGRCSSRMPLPSRAVTPAHVGLPGSRNLEEQALAFSIQPQVEEEPG
jgi:hypothetical protein